MSRLNFKDLTRVGFVSKACREFYMSTLYLNFHDFLVWIYPLVERTKRIEIAVRCNVEVLHLVVTYIRFGELPASILHCKSLKSLLVDMKCTISDVPSIDFLSNPDYLRLKGVSIKDEDDQFLKWISCCCTSMKELLLKDCGFWHESDYYIYKRHVINRSGDRLKNLHLNPQIRRKTRKLVNIYAPNLKCLEWFGECTTSQNLGNLMCLEKAGISSSIPICNFDILFGFLCSIRKVKVLILHPDILELLWLNMDDRKWQDLSFISQAKEVVIPYDEYEPDIEPAYSILEHAHDLEKMTIYYPHCFESFDVHDDLMDVYDDLMELRTEVMSKGIHFNIITTSRGSSLLSSIQSLDDFV
ncbi:F-box protein [Pyrus ussuriensis x Pyrus communis]|uniref:F-box protein n=1 Tax=Pyrus ussuriensis x Pyrus communis TaxID=2448454 RepID=A0A5N5H7Q8_9ROSA|nr:F-box protein [Pyrus ussuriensis x Pyrus communis]